MIRETPVPQLRLSSSSTPEGWVEVTFLGRKIALTPDQAREFQRELTHSIAMATLRPAGVLA